MAQPDTAADDSAAGPAPLRFGPGAVPPVGPTTGAAGGAYASPSDAAYGPVTDDPLTTNPLAADVSSIALSGVGDREVVTVTNTGDEPEWLHVSLDGDPAFRYDGVLSGHPLAPGASVEIGVEFASHVEGAYDGELVLEVADSLLFPKPPVRVPIKGSGAARKTVGTPIEAKSPGGNANTIDSAVSSLSEAWEGLLKEQLAGVDLIQSYAQASPAETPSPIWADLLEAALMIGVIGVTRGLALEVTGALKTLMIKDVNKMLGGDKADVAVYGNLAVALDRKVHAAMHGQVVDTLQSAVAGSISSGILAAKGGSTGGKGKSAIARDSFFEAMKSELNAGMTGTKTAANNTTGDYQALEDEHAGLGFAALEGYRNEIATVALTAKSVQMHKTLGLYGAYLAQARTGTMGEGKNAETDLGGDGGLATNESGKIGAGDQFADGVLVLDMAWGNLSIKQARARGLNENLLALLTTAPLRAFPIPIILAGNVLGTAGKNPQRGEVRVGRNEAGTLYAIAAESEDESRKPGWAFLERAANNDFNERTKESDKGRVLDLDECEQAAKNIFARLDGLTLGSVANG